MISLEDCYGMCGLTREEIDAIAEHEHIPEAAAAALGAYLDHLPDGVDRIATMIRDDIREAQAHGNMTHAATLLAVLRHFLAAHKVGA